MADNTSNLYKFDKGSNIFFYTINTFILLLLAFIVLYPLYFIIIASISDPDAVLAGKVFLYPVNITLSGFSKILEKSDVWKGYLNTIIYTILTVVLSLLVTIPAGWALSRKNLMFRKAFMVYFIIPMFFGGGLIPFYNVMSGLHLVNTVWAIILPSVLSVWNLFMTKTFFESSIPNSLIEAAKIDGAGHFRTFITVVVPLAKPIIAVMALYYAIGQWNSYFNAMIFLQNEKLYPLQLVLKEILIATESTVGGSGETILEQYRLATQIKYVSVIVSSIPVLMLYPFVQKYFEQGVMIGSLKE
ncbi:putative aldouronate transport system permease protein [Treponema bryantii]|uniref:Putative aldouronate transport system permease protein n=1 Tax=Treponema bryantii TaxID=163 RepID=A0A1I3JMK3_9SPIR|nr:carbohydrate ABC transporter permease [Treponema bryantii]SFI61497.1 putative aldouronate transport system permease protein [Treponema bryantii]